MVLMIVAFRSLFALWPERMWRWMDAVFPQAADDVDRVGRGQSGNRRQSETIAQPAHGCSPCTRKGPMALDLATSLR
jgi:hypothetical protein